MYKLVKILMLFLMSGLVYQPGNAVSHSPIKPVDFPYQLQLKTGDIILRNGKGMISDLFRKSSREDQLYSHAGVICESNGKYFVVHILAPNGKTGPHLRIEPISAFCDPQTNKGFGVYRFHDFEGKESQIKKYLRDLSLKKVKFDDQFDLETDQLMYCTELIYKLSRSVAYLELPASKSSGRNYIAIDNLYNHPHATLVVAKQY